ncbi:MAG: membrane protein insertase YidC [Opitutae bacterium]|nr:membrane protein insertase YidC [Opitutae bacterium]MCD8298605.1 membrane protein insertase YidC [Opitutae bacterium]
MDKKNTIIGVTLIVIAIALMFWNSKNSRPQPTTSPTQSVVENVQVPPPPPAVAAEAGSTNAPEQSALAAPEEVFALTNDVITLHVSSRDGALKTVDLEEHAKSLLDKSPVVFNGGFDVPALSLAAIPQARGLAPTALGIAFEKESCVDDPRGESRTLTLVGRANGFEIRRIYKLSLVKNGTGAQDPHLVDHKIKITRVAGEPAAFPFLISTGALPPTEGDRANIFLNASWYDGDDYEKCKSDVFKDSSGVFGIGGHSAAADFSVPATMNSPFRFVAVTNQFFASVVGFSGETRSVVSRIFVFPQALPLAEQIHDVKLTPRAYAQIDVPALSVGQTANLSFPYFVGPKEYTRLSDLRDSIEGIDNVIQFTHLFGFLSVDWICKILVVVMNAIHGVIPANGWSWGWAILIMTLIVKGITWPLTMAQQRSAKKMQKFQGPMKEIREKYKDEPQKMQQEMMKLYRENKINPLAGCFPVLIQIPIFFGMYCAFQTCAELRLEGFLWITDLSMPDLIPGLENVTIPLIGAKIHALPIVMGGTMILNMSLTPMPNAQPGQKNMFYLMMVIFPIICYAMPSALTLYWSMQNIFTLFQSWIVRRSRDKDDAGKNQPTQPEIIPPKKKKKGRGKSLPAA